MLTYTFKIKTSPELIQKIENNFSVTRCIYNLAKETRECAYSKGVKINKFDLIKQLPELKNDFPWMKDVHSQTLQGVIERLDKGYDKFFADLKKGIATSKPKWAKKKNWKSVEFKSSALKIKNDIFEISKIGKIKIFKSREINGNIKLARIVKQVDGYYLQIVTDHEIQKCENQAQLAIDLGISQFVVTSDGEYFENIRTTKKYADKLAEAQKKLSLKKKFSNNFYKEVEKVKKVHLKIRRVREDYLHKISRQLANNYQYIFVEDLDVQKMVQNKDYSKVISDVSWSKFINYLEYKTNVIKVNPAYTSQECSNCGHTAKENRKTQESFKCVKCNHEGNADFEASLTIKKRGQSLLENYGK
jgi:putative transposase